MLKKEQAAVVCSSGYKKETEKIVFSFVQNTIHLFEVEKD
jgi:hypothetical protein